MADQNQPKKSAFICEGDAIYKRISTLVDFKSGIECLNFPHVSQLEDYLGVKKPESIVIRLNNIYEFSVLERHFNTIYIIEKPITNFLKRHPSAEQCQLYRVLRDKDQDKIKFVSESILNGYERSDMVFKKIVGISSKFTMNNVEDLNITLPVKKKIKTVVCQLLSGVAKFVLRH